MRCKYSTLSRFATLIACLTMAVACGTKAKNEKKKKPTVNPSLAAGGVQGEVQYRAFESEPIASFEDIANLTKAEETIRPELKDAFCIHAYKLPLYSDTKFVDEFGVLCNSDQTPTETFAQIDRLASVVGDKPRAMKLSLTHNGDRTEAVFATAYALPIPPKWVRSGAIQNYMTQPSEFSYAKLYGKVAKDLTATLEGDLQFSKYTLYYETETHTPDGKTFFNNRMTQFDAYQVQGGNPDIGLGAEFMMQNSGDYEYFNTITVTIGTKSGGSVVITVVRLAVKNNGYPDIAASLVSDTMLSQATNVHDGLWNTLQQYVVK